MTQFSEPTNPYRVKPPVLFERIAFAIVPVEVRYPDRIVVLLLVRPSTNSVNLKRMLRLEL